MGDRKKKEGLLLRIFRRLSSSKLSMKEYVFALCITLAQIGVPLIYELIGGESNRFWQIPITGMILFFIFILVWKPEEFVQINLIEFVFFQIITVVIVLLLASPVVFYFREEVQSLYGIQIEYLGEYLKGVVLVGYMVIKVVAVFVFYEIGAGVLLWIYACVFLRDIKNPFLEKMKAARSMEDYEAYQKRKIREAYENFEYENVNHGNMNYDNVNYENMNHENVNYENMNHGNVNHENMNHKYVNHSMPEENVYKPKPLFENTQFFKQITDLEQVKPRYHAMMKIYHPDNAGGNTEKTMELQKEYQEIAKKYNL